MRTRLLIAIVMALQLGGCVYKRDASGLPGWPDGATFEPPPTRMVSGDGPVGAGSTTEGGLGGTVLGPPVDARPAPDAPADAAPDSRASDAGPQTGDGSSSPAACNIVAQNCPRVGDACYRAGCSVEGRGGEFNFCAVDEDCIRQHICIDDDGQNDPAGRKCRLVCNPQDARCRCRPLPGFGGIGFCEM